MGSDRITKRTNCRLCGYLCGLLAHIEDGRVVGIEPDPSRYPYDAALLRRCRRCRSNLELVTHPARLNYPLKRVGERGSGKWMRMTWPEAMDEIAERLSQLKERHGPETLATSIGGPHTTYWPLHRFMNLFGSPNNMGIGQICWNPAIWANTLTFGWPLENDFDPEQTGCVILWGINPAESDNSLFWQTIKGYSRGGSPFIVIDPRQTRTALCASRWLPIQPGADCALALGLLHVIITENLYDQSFVESWCSGFEALSEHVMQYNPIVVGEITGLPAETIRETARLYAGHHPAVLITGRGIDQIGGNSFQTHRALALLRAITGNVDMPGASHLSDKPDFVPEVDLELNEKLSEGQRQKQLGLDRWLLQSYHGYDLVNRFTARSGKRLPMRYLTSAHPNLVWRAMLTGRPYPIRAMIVMASNPLLSQADSRLIRQALKSLDLLVALDLYHTPTTMLADYVLPSAGGLERPVLQTNAGTANIAYGGDRAIAPLYERRVDFDFWRGLGVRMGQEDEWPWQTFEESLDAIMAPLKMSWREFSETGLYCPPRSYRKFEEVDECTGQPIGFATPSGKIELYSAIMEELHSRPLPECALTRRTGGGDPHGPTPVALQGCHRITQHSPEGGTSSELLRAEGVAPSAPPMEGATRAPLIDPPLTLITGARKQPYYASAFRQIDSLRQQHPVPWAEMSAQTAAALGLTAGERVWVETRNSRACFSLKIRTVRINVVSVEYGWWYPERPMAEPELGGVWESNANVLTSADAQECEQLLGQWTYNGLPCRVYSAEENREKPLEADDENQGPRIKESVR